MWHKQKGLNNTRTFEFEIYKHKDNHFYKNFIVKIITILLKSINLKVFHNKFLISILQYSFYKVVVLFFEKR